MVFRVTYYLLFVEIYEVEKTWNLLNGQSSKRTLYTLTQKKSFKKVNLMLLLREIKRSQCYINFKTMEKHGFQSLNVLLLKFLTSATEAFTK